nr:HNH endonuclease [Rubrivivax albus]
MAELAIWRRGDVRAPHKPLLLLLALARRRKGITDFPYSDCEPLLAKLLREFGRSARSVHPEYPFWRLQNDGVWIVDTGRPLKTRASNSDPPRSELRSAGAIGRFTPQICEEFSSNPTLIDTTARQLLDAHFPSSLHEDILCAVGLPLDLDSPGLRDRRSRDPAFRLAVLQAYAYNCAICGLDLRIGNLTIGLEAAHIRWYQASGPDIVPNGLALCSLHHKLFDYGAVTIDENSRVLVSEQAHGTAGFEEHLIRHHGQKLRSTVRPEDKPLSSYTQWHRLQVFKARARPA